MICKFSEELFLKTPVVGILRGYTKTKVLKIAMLYHQTGFTNLEITMNTPNALEIIGAVAHQFQGKLNVGAGTVLTKEEVDAVLEVGGQFIVSPVTDIPIIKYCKLKGIPIFPGAYSPTEIYQAWRAGARMVKLFPARNLGATYVQDVLAPLDNIEIMPTGGVTLDNLQDYLDASAKAFGMGGYLFKKELIEAEDWDELAAYLKYFMKHIDI